jgi:hypothetical protein
MRPADLAGALAARVVAHATYVPPAARYRLLEEFAHELHLADPRFDAHEFVAAVRDEMADAGRGRAEADAGAQEPAA